MKVLCIVPHCKDILGVGGIASWVPSRESRSAVMQLLASAECPLRTGKGGMSPLTDGNGEELRQRGGYGEVTALWLCSGPAGQGSGGSCSLGSAGALGVTWRW